MPPQNVSPQSDEFSTIAPERTRPAQHDRTDRRGQKSDPQLPDARSLSTVLEDDIRQSLDAMGLVCRSALLCGLTLILASLVGVALLLLL